MASHLNRGHFEAPIMCQITQMGFFRRCVYLEAWSINSASDWAMLNYAGKAGDGKYTFAEAAAETVNAVTHAAAAH